ncbi:MAG: Roadblock/LC7 family protein [Chloroflexi bacterium]|jgi:predicted regulator of Ras-like GTPase activity (Roadblock/LC7/MglB family)|nr:Roadblock/LC7 family protein [Chloroflexota bacterium]
MTFTEILLDAANQIEGALVVGLAGIDGLGVETVVNDGSEFDTEAVEVEIAGLVNNISKTATALSSGAVKEFYVETENHNILVHVLDKDYFLVVILGPQANLGRARFEARRVSQKLSESL